MTRATASGRRSACSVTQCCSNDLILQLLGKSLVTHRFQRAVVAARPIGGAQRDWNRMLTVASSYYAAQVRRYRERLLPINPSFAETARWKRCVPRGDFHCFRACLRPERLLLKPTSLRPPLKPDRIRRLC